MFGLFSKNETKELQKEYKRLMEASFKLSKTDRMASDLKRAEADKVAEKIEALLNRN